MGLREWQLLLCTITRFVRLGSSCNWSFSREAFAKSQIPYFQFSAPSRGLRGDLGPSHHITHKYYLCCLRPPSDRSISSFRATAPGQGRCLRLLELRDSAEVPKGSLWMRRGALSRGRSHNNKQIKISFPCNAALKSISKRRVTP